MAEPQLEDNFALGKGDPCDWCGEQECGCGEPDPDGDYDRSRED